MKREVRVHGGFFDDMKIDALLVANTSWLRAILWAFIVTLRQKTIETLGENPFPLLLLDDPQTTFDPRNKRCWAKEIVRLANLDNADPLKAQLFLTTNERQFFTLVTEQEKLAGQKGLIVGVNAVSGVATIANGNVLERLYRQAVDGNDDAKARDFIRQVRIYIDDLLKYLLRGEGPHIGEANLDRLRGELKRLRDAHTAPFNRKPFGELLDVISGGEKHIALINDPPHTDDETIGVAEAKTVHEFWEKTLGPRIHKAFHAFAAFEAHHGDPRTFEYPATVVSLPSGNADIVRSAKVYETGIAAAAKTDGRIGDGYVQLIDTGTATSVDLCNHAVFRLTADTLEPVAFVGDFLIVRNFGPVNPRNIVVAAVGTRRLARRFNISDTHPELAILTAQAVNPYSIAGPEIVPIKDLEYRKVVGTLFASRHGLIKLGADEIEAPENTDEYFRLLNEARLFKVQGRSAEPIALDGQYLIASPKPVEPSHLKQLEGRPVIAFDSEGTSYFKRLRHAQAGLFILESLNPDGTTAAELLSADGREGIPRLKEIVPVHGVLFEILGPQSL
jgi:hypothetical protein